MNLRLGIDDALLFAVRNTQNVVETTCRVDKLHSTFKFHLVSLWSYVVETGDSETGLSMQIYALVTRVVFEPPLES